MSQPAELYYSSSKGMIVDYWQTLADTYGLPVELVKMLYDDWNTQEYPNFGDYVMARQKEAISSA